LRESIEPKRELQPLDDQLGEDYEALDETEEEWTEEAPVDVTPALRAEIEAEANDLEAMAALAESVGHNAKGAALLQALGVAMDKTAELGAERKAIIFTESRKTQDYLQRILADTEWKDGIVLFNGTNTDEKSREILKRWQEEHKGTDRVTGSRTADMRSALVDYFRNEGQIMIATEAAAEGINLQFCSLVVNYDLPWNPQRIEQRIGRCHRYGQKHDVVVVNFLNQKNEADQRVYQLLALKFQLFEGVFGASDEVLGALESGVDFERRIAEIYQNARRPEEIEEAFTQLQMELSPEINAQMQRTRQLLLENLDQEVVERLRVQQKKSQQAMTRHERTLWQLTEHELRDVADFHDESSFTLKRSPNGASIPTGRYELPRHSPDAHIYRVAHPLAQHVIAEAKDRDLPPAEIVFQLTGRLPRIMALEPFVGKFGHLAIVQMTIEALDTAEDHLILAAVSEDGEEIDEGLVWRMLRLPARGERRLVFEPCEALDRLVHRRQVEIADEVATRNLEYFQAETEKLDAWSDDQKVGLEREIKELDRQIREARKASKSAFTLEEKLEAQKQTRALESERNRKKRELFDAQDEVEARREKIIGELEAKLSQVTSARLLFRAAIVLC
jgi:adenine-specific DNA-methyltransferase